MKRLLFNILLGNETCKYSISLPYKIDIDVFRAFVNSNFDQYTLKIHEQDDQDEQDDQEVQHKMVNEESINFSIRNVSCIYLYEQDTKHKIPFIVSLNNTSTLQLYCKLKSSTLNDILCRLGYSLIYKLDNNEVLAYFSDITGDFLIFTGIRYVDIDNISKFIPIHMLYKQMKSFINIYNIDNLNIQDVKLLQIYNKSKPIAVTNSMEIFNAIQPMYLYADMNFVFK